MPPFALQSIAKHTYGPRGSIIRPDVLHLFSLCFAHLPFPSCRLEDWHTNPLFANDLATLGDGLPTNQSLLSPQTLGNSKRGSFLSTCTLKAVEEMVLGQFCPCVALEIQMEHMEHQQKKREGKTWTKLAQDHPFNSV